MLAVLAISSISSALGAEREWRIPRSAAISAVHVLG